MTEIRRVLKQAAWRLIIVDLFRNLSMTMAAAVGLLIAILLAERVLGVAVSFPSDWLSLAAAALGAGAAAAVVWTLIRRARGVALARIVDERADLRESLSTAMYVARSQDPWASVVVETARDKAKRVDVRRAIPIVAPRLWFLPLAMVLSMAILWFSLPNWDLLGALSQREQAQRQQFEIQQVREEIKRDEERLEELLRRAGVELKEEEATREGRDAHAPLTPDDVRRAAIRRLTSLQDQLADLKQSAEAQRMDSLKQMMRQLRTPGPGPAEQLSRQLAQGNFQQAQQELEQLAQQLASANMSPEDQQRLQQQLQQLAQQLQQLAENRQELERRLQQAGLTPEQARQSAADPEALKKALEELQNLTEEQKKQLAEMAKAMSEAASACGGMGEALSQMAAGLSQAGLDQSGMQGLENLAGQLSAFEMMQADMDSLDAAMSEAMKQLSKLGSACAGKPGDCEGGDCEGGECEGDCEGCEGGASSPWRLGSAQGSSAGRGPGRGTSVRNWDDVDAPVNIEKVKSPTRQGDGPIIGTRLVYGDQVRGESVAEFVSVVESSAKAATEALDPMTVPRELHDSVKGYFGRLEARARAQRVADPSKQAEEPR